MNLVFLGSPASGKGTQAELVAKKLNLQYFEAGDILREIAKEKTSLGQEVDRIMNQEGELLPDEIVNQVVSQWLAKTEARRGIVFDGYPRKLSQYQALRRMLTEKNTKVDKVIFLKVSQETSIRRISSRRVCPKCDGEYNLVTEKPKKDELCDQCQVGLVQREDDKPEVVKKRLEVYQQITQPLVDHIRQQKILMEVDGERPIEEIHQDVMERLKP